MKYKIDEIMYIKKDYDKYINSMKSQFWQFFTLQTDENFEDNDLINDINENLLIKELELDKWNKYI